MRNLTAISKESLIEKMAVAIAASQGFKFTGVSIVDSENPRCAMFVAMAIAAIESIEEHINLE
ncbi:MAG: hypothetical protein JO235_02060 [Chroococcidiopsidaceae cyanobacterium CP_BM_RX_35]|nr:hypothetical protein [Chroococcidiopsidaceae cyanobacterium CP_BM_RX_35]